jgi:hypothetical protein
LSPNPPPAEVWDPAVWALPAAPSHGLSSSPGDTAPSPEDLHRADAFEFTVRSLRDEARRRKVGRWQESETMDVASLISISRTAIGTSVAPSTGDVECGSSGGSGTSVSGWECAEHTERVVPDELYTTRAAMPTPTMYAWFHFKECLMNIVSHRPLPAPVDDALSFKGGKPWSQKRAM